MVAFIEDPVVIKKILMHLEEKALTRAALGGVSTGVYGAVRGSSDVGNRALAGAAAGVVRGGVQSTEESLIFKNFVNKCLSDKGCSVIGWQ